MQFSDDQKRIIQKIATGKINDLNSYIDLETRFEKIDDATQYQFEYMKVGGSVGGGEVGVIDNEDTLRVQLLSFLALCSKLRRVGLLEIAKGAPLPMPRLVVNTGGGRKAPPQIDAIYCNNPGYQVVAFEDLKTFIDNGHLTADEINQQAERQARVVAQRWTIGVAVVGMLSSAIISGYSAYTSTTDRYVTLRNVNDRVHPIVVEIVPPPTTVKAGNVAGAPAASVKKQ
ncbi:MAG: hypothetical protein AABY83_06750 [Pseudomonadota bacterium]